MPKKAAVKKPVRKAKPAASAEPSGSERRQYPRVPTQILLEVKPPIEFPTDPTSGVIVNLSLGGLAFESKSRLDPGTEIYIAMEKPLALTGRIVHVFPNGDSQRYGVRFTNLGVFSERTLEKHVSLVLRKG